MVLGTGNKLDRYSYKRCINDSRKSHNFQKLITGKEDCDRHTRFFCSIFFSLRGGQRRPYGTTNCVFPKCTYPLLQKVKRNDGIRVQYVVENPSIREFFKKVDIMLELMIPTLTIQKYQVLAEL